MRKSILQACILCVLFCAGSCGMKAPPQPRGSVVPAPVKDVYVKVDPPGPRITFTLPATSIDGTPLKKIGGYRVLRNGPGGKDLREEMLFSVSEQISMVGKVHVFQDVPPAVPGRYLYCVVPLDSYGSSPRGHLWVGLQWEGLQAGDEKENGSARIQ